jgi:L-iditol 2-dehydrogenase
MEKFMKTAMLYAPGDLRIEEIETPKPNEGEVIIETKVSLTCGTDLKKYKRGYPLWKPPYPMGHEFSGIIAEVGGSVKRFKVGDRVVSHNTAPCGYCYYCKVGNFSLCENIDMIPGVWQKYVKIPSSIVKQNLFILPERMSFKLAALTEPLACAVYGVDESNIKIGDYVSIIGAGPLGLFLAKLAKLRGAIVIVTDISDFRLGIAKKINAADFIMNISDIKDQAKAVRELTPNSRGVDIAIEAVGTPETWEIAISMLRKGGLATLFGGCASGTSITIDTKLLHYSQLTLKGILHTTPRHVNAAFTLLSNGVIDEKSFIYNDYPLEEVEAALLEHASGKVIKNSIIF